MKGYFDGKSFHGPEEDGKIPNEVAENSIFFIDSWI